MTPFQPHRILHLSLKFVFIGVHSWFLLKTSGLKTSDPFNAESAKGAEWDDGIPPRLSSEIARIVGLRMLRFVSPAPEPERLACELESLAPELEWATLEPEPLTCELERSTGEQEPLTGGHESATIEHDALTAGLELLTGEHESLTAGHESLAD